MAISREAGCGLFLGPDPVTKGSPFMEYIGETEMHGLVVLRNEFIS